MVASHLLNDLFSSSARKQNCLDFNLILNSGCPLNSNSVDGIVVLLCGRDELVLVCLTLSQF